MLPTVSSSSTLSGSSSSGAPEGPSSGTPGGVQVIARVAQVFRALDGEPQGLSLTQLAVRLGLPRSTVHRIVSALLAEGLLESASPSGRVRIGPEFARLATNSRRELWREVEPFMRRIFDALGETVDCAVLDGDHVRVVHLIVTHHPLRAVADVGATFPLYGSSKGKVLIAQLEPDEVKRLLPAQLERYTERTQTKLGLLLEELAEIRRGGVAYNLEEVTPGVCSAAIAVRDPFGALVAISVVTPAQRFHDRREEITRVLLEVRRDALAAFNAVKPPKPGRRAKPAR